MTQSSSIARIEASIIAFLREQGFAVPEGAAASDIALLESNLLDSLGLVHLLMTLGEEFGVEVEDTDFTPENFENVSTLSSLIAQKRQELAA